MSAQVPAVPRADLPTTDLPTTDRPTTELPTTDLPTADCPAIGTVGRPRRQRGGDDTPGPARSGPTVTRSPMRLSPPPVHMLASSAWPDELFASPPPGVAPEPVDLVIESRSGSRTSLEAPRWHCDPGPADLALLERTRGPVLDIGCGPGRLVHALVCSGRLALGIDTSAAAVATARGRGAPAVHTSVFGPVPSAGQWGTALLLDGNIGIGGNVWNLLRQTAQLVAPNGLILVEVSSPTTPSEETEVRIDLGGRRGGWFPWSTIAVGDLPALAAAAGLVTNEVWEHTGRWFAELSAGVSVEEEAAS